MVITHITTVHKRFDTRIFLKQCRSLNENNYKVNLIVADGQGDQVIEGIKIYDTGKYKSRTLRVLFSPFKVLKIAIRKKSDLYHFHDPELIPIGIILRMMKRRVIFDAHEDIPNQLLSKPYIPNILKPLISKTYDIFDRLVCNIWSGVIGATPFIKDKYLSYGCSAVAVNNFPILEEFSHMNFSDYRKKNQVFYIGAFSLTRGIKEMVYAMKHVKSDTTLVLGGEFADNNFENEVKNINCWSKVDHKGWLPRSDVQKNLQSSFAGLVVLHPTKSYLDSLPVKMFEYMSAGVAVIASDFPLWSSIINTEKCGICVDPLLPSSIANAIDYLSENPDKAMEMGKNGRKAIINKYNWENEKEVLLSFYSSILNNK